MREPCPETRLQLYKCTFVPFTVTSHTSQAALTAHTQCIARRCHNARRYIQVTARRTTQSDALSECVNGVEHKRERETTECSQQTDTSEKRTQHGETRGWCTRCAAPPSAGARGCDINVAIQSYAVTARRPARRTLHLLLHHAVACCGCSHAALQDHKRPREAFKPFSHFVIAGPREPREAFNPDTQQSDLVAHKPAHARKVGSHLRTSKPAAAASRAH